MSKQYLSLMDFSAGLIQRGFNEVNWPSNAVVDGLNVRVGPEGISSGMSEEVVYDFGAGSVIRNIWQAYFALDDLHYLVVAVDAGGITRIYASLNFNPDSPVFTEIYNYGGIAGQLTAARVNDRLIINDGVLAPPLVFSGAITADGSDWASMRQALMSDDGENYYGVGDYLADTDPGSFVSLNQMGQSGGLYICDEKNGLAGFVVEIQGAANPGVVTIVEYWQGTTWAVVTGLVDGTSGFTRNGIISFTAPAVSYAEVAGLAGFWYRIRLSGYTGSDLRITRIRLKSLVAPLANIGSGIDDIAMGFMYYDASANSWKDFSLEVADNTQVTFARLNDGAIENAVGMDVGDYIYVGGADEFLKVKIELERNHTNINASVMSAEYWNGLSWASATAFVDGTSYGGKTLNQSGYVRFGTANWKPRRVGAIGALGYWIRLKVNAALTATTYVCEVRLFSKPAELSHYRMVCALRDRLALIGRSDAPDQIDISREGEEYGFNGEDSCSIRIGGQGPIYAAVEAFNQLWLCKGDEWYMLNGYNPATFAIERAETSQQTACGHYAIVSAPIKAADGINRHGFYFVNDSGIWNFTGLQINGVSDYVSWFEHGETRAVPDAVVSGIFNASRYELWWALKFRDAEGNLLPRIVVYDLGRQTWNCPFETNVSVLSIVRGTNNDGSLDSMMVLGGGIDGKLVRIDEGSDETREQYCETGWINFKSTEWEKRIHGLKFLGRFGDSMRVSFSRDGAVDVYDVVLGRRTDNPGFELISANESMSFNILKTGFRWTGPGRVNGLLLEVAWDRNRPMDKIFEG